MICEDFRDASVSDEPEERERFRLHAAGCSACAAALADDRRLLDAAAEWRRDSPAPPPALAARITAAMEAELEDGEPVRVIPLRPRRHAGASRPRAWLAAAAVLVLAVLGGQFLLVDRGGSELARAVREVHDAEETYSRAIARLESEATAVLDRSADPALPPRDASILMAYRDRLQHLDSVIDEVQGFLDENPGHSGGHTVLLAAYTEKDELLREILDLQPGEI